MEWSQLLSAERSRGRNDGRRYPDTDLRSEFEKDYHRIIGSASFRRLQDKTQVFPLDKSDFIRTRLTHSLEVSSFAKSLGQNIGAYILAHKKQESFTMEMKEDISSILQCAGLIHDIGNPPFGHYGEMAIREWFGKYLPKLEFEGMKLEKILSPQMKADLLNFEGNAQAFRLVTKLHYLVDEHGMNLTYALLNTIIKYPVSSLETDPDAADIKYKKIGYYLADEDVFRFVTEATGAGKCRHPLVYILEAADDLAYRTADVEDAYVKKFISYFQLREELRKLEEGKLQGKFLPLSILDTLYKRGIEQDADQPEEYAVKNWIVKAQSFLINCATAGFATHYDEIMNGTYQGDLFKDTAAEALIEVLGRIAYERVFSSAEIFKLEVIEAKVLDNLMEKFVNAILYYDTEHELSSIDTRLVEMISDNYKKAYHSYAKGGSREEKLYLRLLLVTDYICGMTDSYARRLYQELNAMT